jgi:hypothetical protein
MAGGKMTHIITLLLIISAVISPTAAKTITFQYDRDKKDEFHGLSLTGGCNNEKNWCDPDFCLRGDYNRGAFYYSKNLNAWLAAHPKFKIQKATLSGFSDSAKFLAGTLEYAGLLYDMSTNLSVWGDKAPDSEKTEWIDWKFKPGKEILPAYQLPVKVTAALSAAAPTGQYDLDVTALVQYIQQNPGKPWGFVYFGTGGKARVLFLSEENYPTEKQKTAGQNMIVVIEGK